MESMGHWCEAFRVARSSWSTLNLRDPRSFALHVQVLSSWLPINMNRMTGPLKRVYVFCVWHRAQVRMREMCKGQMESTRRSRIGGGRGTSSASPEQCHCIPKLLMSNNRKILSAKHPQQNCSAPALYINTWYLCGSYAHKKRAWSFIWRSQVSTNFENKHQVFILYSWVIWLIRHFWNWNTEWNMPAFLARRAWVAMLAATIPRLRILRAWEVWLRNLEPKAVGKRPGVSWKTLVRTVWLLHGLMDVQGLILNSIWDMGMGQYL